MTQKLIAWTCLGLALLLALLAGLTLVAMVQALMVGSTLAAIESAFGSFVLCILLMLAARKFHEVGRARLRQEGQDT